MRDGRHTFSVVYLSSRERTIFGVGFAIADTSDCLSLIVMRNLGRPIFTWPEFGFPWPYDIEKSAEVLTHLSRSLSNGIAIHSEIRRNGHICGSFASFYPGLAAPLCAGDFSLRSSVGLKPGCCNDQNVCQFYATCYDHANVLSSTSEDLLMSLVKGFMENIRGARFDMESFELLLTWNSCPRSCPYMTTLQNQCLRFEA